MKKRSCIIYLICIFFCGCISEHTPKIDCVDFCIEEQGYLTFNIPVYKDKCMFMLNSMVYPMSLPANFQEKWKIPLKDNISNNDSCKIFIEDAISTQIECGEPNFMKGYKGMSIPILTFLGTKIIKSPMAVLDYLPPYGIGSIGLEFIENNNLLFNFIDNNLSFSEDQFELEGCTLVDSLLIPYQIKNNRMYCQLTINGQSVEMVLNTMINSIYRHPLDSKYKYVDIVLPRKSLNPLWTDSLELMSQNHSSTMLVDHGETKINNQRMDITFRKIKRTSENQKDILSPYGYLTTAFLLRYEFCVIDVNRKFLILYNYRESRNYNVSSRKII